jgi:hypothetical protein
MTKAYFAFLLLMVPVLAFAEGGELLQVSSAAHKTTLLQKAGFVLLVEGVVYANAVAAKNAPELYGGSLALLSPLSATESNNDHGNIFSMAGTAGLGLYNLLDSGRDSDSERRRFWTTFIGIHAVGAAASAISSLTGGKPAQKADPGPTAGSFLLLPGKDAVTLAFCKRF